MKSTDMGQVVVDPKDATDELLEAVQKAIAGESTMELTRRLRFRLFMADVLHNIGIHHWVHYRTFDPTSGRIIVHPGKWVCALCPKGKIE